MYKFQDATGRVIADDVMTAMSAIDAALMSHYRLNLSVLEGSDHRELPPATKQELLEALQTTPNILVESRRAAVEGHRRLAVIHRNSNLAETDYGCVGGPEEGAQGRRSNLFTTGSAAAALRQAPAS